MPTKHIPRTAAARQSFQQDMERLRQQLEQKHELAQARYARTAAANRVRQTMSFLLEPPYGDGLPQWWPYWGAKLKELVRELARTASRIEALERAVGAEPETSKPRVRCSRCHQQFEVSPAHWTTCPACRPAGEGRPVITGP